MSGVIQHLVLPGFDTSLLLKTSHVCYNPTTTLGHIGHLLWVDKDSNALALDHNFCPCDVLTTRIIVRGLWVADAQLALNVTILKLVERSLRLTLAVYSLPCSWQYELNMDARVDKQYDSWFMTMVRLELCNKWQKSYACTLPLVPFTIPLLLSTREFMLDPRIWLDRLMCGQSGNYLS